MSKILKALIFLLASVSQVVNASEVTVNLSDVKTYDKFSGITLKIKNVSHQTVTIDQKYVSFEDGQMWRGIIWVSKIVNDKKINVMYVGAYLDYGEFHDYSSTAVKILPGETLVRIVNLSRNYNIQSSGKYEFGYTGIINNDKGEEEFISTKPIIHDIDCGIFMCTKTKIQDSQSNK